MTTRFFKLAIFSAFFTLFFALFAATSVNAQNISTLDALLSTPDGDQTSVATLGEDKVTIVSFGATWCAPCKKEMAAMNKVYDSLQANGIEYVAIFIDNTKTMARVGPYVRAKGFSFPTLLDPESELFALLGGTEVPYALIFGMEGEVAFKHDSFLEGDEEHILEEAFSLLPQSEEEM